MDPEKTSAEQAVSLVVGRTKGPAGPASGRRTQQSKPAPELPEPLAPIGMAGMLWPSLRSLPPRHRGAFSHGPRSSALCEGGAQARGESSWVPAVPARWRQGASNASASWPRLGGDLPRLFCQRDSPRRRHRLQAPRGPRGLTSWEHGAARRIIRHPNCACAWHQH